MISIPHPLELLFRQLNEEAIRPIVVGGFVRDSLLGLDTADIDIELYGITSMESLEKLLQKFGKVNLVGKSFGVLKMNYHDYSLDFAPPRSESKQGNGHKGFEIHSHTTLDYTEASRRRDFTINSMGYDPLTHELLDPHGGYHDLLAKRLCYINKESFGDDPLRVLRAVQFAARFELKCDESLLVLCREMISQGALEELPKERIFEEIKKLLLLSRKPSIGLKVLDEIGGSYLLFPTKTGWESALKRCDTLKTSSESKDDLPLLFASLLLEAPNPIETLTKIVYEHALQQKILSIIDYYHHYAHFDYPPPPLLQGRDLIDQGLLPSTRFKSILNAAHHAQKLGEFNTHDQAIKWLKRYLVTVS